ncbi:MAG: IS630 transposase-related protein [Betaproteobacteria bacterium]|nr:IS630 transposase-related protein [Betaproteobacteria bacterium]
MAYSKDFRCLVLDFVANGGSKAEATRRFGISRQSVFDWLKHPPIINPASLARKGAGSTIRKSCERRYKPILMPCCVSWQLRAR